MRGEVADLVGDGDVDRELGLYRRNGIADTDEPAPFGEWTNEPTVDLRFFVRRKRHEHL